MLIAMATIAKHLTVASYNIHRAVGMDGLRNTARTTAVIDHLNADIVAIQEVEWGLPAHEAWLESYAERRGYTLKVDPNIRDHRGHFGNVLLSRCPVAATERIDLAVDRFEPRAAIAATVELGDGPVLVVATHLGLRAGERRQQAGWLARFIEDRSPARAILLGDLNEWRRSNRSIRALMRLFEKAPSPRSFPSGRPLFALDRILFRGFEERPRVMADREPLYRMASDHLPVTARMRLN